MEAIWPDITDAQIAETWKHMQNEHEKVLREARIQKEPPVLPEQDRTALERIFYDLDNAGAGHVSFEALAAARDECDLPIVDPDRLEHYKAEWDSAGSGCIMMEQFILMMCP